MNALIPLDPRFQAAADEALRVDPIKLERDRSRVLRGFWRKLKANAGRIPFAEDAVAAYLAATDRETPWKAKAVLLGALAYFIAPVDAIPDMIAVLGYTDDAAVLYLALRTVRDAITPLHRMQARAWFDGRLAQPTSAEEVAAGPVIEAGPEEPAGGPASGR